VRALRLSSVCAIALMLALAGCINVGPDYKVPKDAMVNAPFANGAIDGVDGKVATQAPVPDNWWRLYNDPVLDGLIVQALHSNTDLRVAAANLAKSRADVAFAQAQGGFSGGASASVNRERLSGEQFLIPQEIPVSTDVDSGLRISYEIDLFGVIRRGVEAANADDEAVEAAVDVTRITVVADVVRAYVQTCSAGEQLAIAQRSLDLQQQRTEVTRRLRDEGRGNTPDVTRNETEIQNISASLPQFTEERRIAQYRLAALLAEPPANLPQAVFSCERIPHIDQPIPAGDGAALLRRRPDVREAERKLAASTARIGVAIGALYPTISIGASAGLVGQAKDLPSAQTQHYGYGPLVSWTFPINGARERVQEAKAETQAQLARFDGVVLTALRETESGLAMNVADSQRVQALQAAQESAGKAADQVHRLYVGGRESFIADLDATRTLTIADAQLAAAQARTAQDQVTLFLALGGGWETAHEAGTPAAPDEKVSANNGS
jgi:NodT family efflux transporter outer membrane factor (OMF) lipoprotein